MFVLNLVFGIHSDAILMFSHDRSSLFTGFFAVFTVTEVTRVKHPETSRLQMNLLTLSLSPCPFHANSPEPPGSSLCHRGLFCPSAQRIRQQQSVLFWSQRPPALPAGSTKTWSHRQPASSHHRPHEGKAARVCVCVCGGWFVYENYQVTVNHL